MTFLGEDGHLRSYLYWYGEWKQVSPLIMGWDKLLELAKECVSVAYFRSLGFANGDSIVDQSAFPCINGSAWLSFIPISEDFIAVLRKQSCDKVADILVEANIIATSIKQLLPKG
jgi:hypothetical protein